MKKLIAGLFTALALTLGLVTVAGVAPASAAGYPPPPPPPVVSPIAISTPPAVRAGKAPVIPIAGGVNGIPASGKAIVKITKGPKGLAKKLKKAFSKSFSGGKLTLPKKKFKKPGIYKVKITIGSVTKTVKIKIKKK